VYPFASCRVRVRLQPSPPPSRKRWVWSDEPNGRNSQWEHGRSRSASPPTSTITVVLPSLLVDQVEPIQPPDDPQEVDPFFRYDNPSPSDGWSVSSSPGHLRLPAPADIPLTTPPPNRTMQHPLPTPVAPGPDFDENDEVPEPYTPPLTSLTMSPPVPNARLSYPFEPVFVWWLPKGISSCPHLYF